MKKITFLFIAMLVSAFSWQATAQVAIGEQDGTTSFLPIYSCYGYSYSQQLIYQNEINATGDITSISFYYSNTTAGSNDNSTDWTIYLGHTTKTEFSSTTDWVGIADLDQVFTGTVAYPADGNWITINFDIPFSYDGTNNLVVAVDENQSGYNCSIYFGKTADFSVQRGIYYRSDSINPDPTTPPTASGRNSYINNMILGGIQQSCPAPLDFVASNITETTVDLAWTEVGTSTEWEVTYGPEGFDPLATGNTETVNGSPSYTLTGLSPSTGYDVYLRSICSVTDESSLIGPRNFATSCVAVTEFFEDFEATTGSDFPVCWAKVGATGSAYPQNSSGITGARNLYMYNGATVSMPVVSNASDETHQMTMNVRANFTAGETIEFGYLTDASDASSFTVVSSIVTNSNTVPQEFTTIPTGMPAGNVVFALRAIGGLSVLIDDVSWEAIPSCPAPTALSATSMLLNSADIEWTAGHLETSWNIAWGAPGFTPGDANQIGIDTASATNYQITGLTGATSYDVYVQADCGGDESVWVGPLSIYTGHCIPTTTGNSGYINNFTAEGDSGQDISNLNSGAGLNNGYSDFSAQMVIGSPGSTIDYTLSTASGTVGLKIWVDWNNDLQFDASEIVYQSSTYNDNYTGSFTIPATASGDYKMRVGSSYTPNSGPANACVHTGSGEYEDYTISAAVLAPCTGVPNAGIATVNPTSGNPGSTYTVSAQGYALASDMSFQWQSNTNGQGWQDEGTATSTYTTYTATAPSELGDTVQWRLALTCTPSQETTYSDIATFTVVVTYCEPNFTSTVEPITRVLFAGIDNPSPAATGGDGYEDFTAIVAQVETEGTYSFVAEGNTSGSFTNYFTVWIDWNQDGVFDASEMYPIGSIYNSTGTDGQQAINDITVPATALEGDTRMRVIKNFSTSPTNPCGSYSFGQAEDYTVNVTQAMSVVDFSLLSDIRLYPNPMSTNTFHIKAPKLNGESVAITVNDMLGREVYTAEQLFSGSSLQVNLGQDLMNGIYIVTLKTKGEVQSFRIVKR